MTIENAPAIIINNTLNATTPAPTGSLDTSGVTVGVATGVTGIGQMTTSTNPATTGLSVCTGTLINPRTVIFAAHCVNNQAASSYGVNGTAAGLFPNGTPMAFGFGANNTPAVRQWLGLSSGTLPAGSPSDANPALKYTTNTNRALYEVEQVWYNPASRSSTSCTSASSCFLEGDIAMATLDTPAAGVPTWALLFSPLTSETHASLVGYGTNGTAASAQGAGPCTTVNTDGCGPLGGIDFRRRAAENMLSTLSSLNDRSDFLFGPAVRANPQNLYQVDFDSPAGGAAFSTAAGRYDFDLYGGAALPREGITAPGDSGGPLIVDRKYSRPVVVGTLSGGSRFFNAQRGSTYGTSSFYQPLFLFWDLIVANNAYVYAGNKAGDGNWEDGSHWVSLMDPNYFIDVNGNLVNALPDTPAQGITGNTVKFGNICFITDCEDLSQDSEARPLPVGSGTPVYVPGGPGSTDFVPNNVTANPKAGVKARYYDVTLSAAGTTTLSSVATVDALTINGPTKLSIAKAGDLKVLGEINQVAGWTHVDGTLRSNSDMMFATGLLSGSGLIKAPFVTTAAAVIAPGGGDKIGTLTVSGNMIVASGSSLFIDAQRGKADQLAVTANGSSTGTLTLSQNDTTGAKPSLVFNKVTDGPAPRAGESYVIASAAGGRSGTFGQVYTFQGVLRPELTYGPTTITALLRAGSLVTILDGQNATAIAFANALDQLRTGFYDKLYNLYGNVDWMNGAQLNAAFNALSPANMLGETERLQNRQSMQMLGNVTDRLSLMGTGVARGISFTGSPMALTPASQHSAYGFGTASRSISAPLAGGLSGFVTMSEDNVRSSYGDQRQVSDGQRGRYYATGVEAPFGDVRIGVAVGYAQSISQVGLDQSRSKLTQAAAYTSAPLGGGAYVGGVISAEESRISSNRMATDTVTSFRLSGATHSSRYSATVEAGVRKAIGGGLSFNPRAQLGYSHYGLDGFREHGGETALELNSLSMNRLEGRIGARLDGTAHVAGWTVVPQVQADFVRMLAGGRNGLNLSFAAAPDYDFVLPLTNGGSGWAEVKGGFSMNRGAVTLGFSGSATAGDAPISDKRALASVGIKF